MSVEKLGLTAEEAQFLETRAYGRTEIGAIYRVPASFLGEQQKLSNSNLQEQNKDFYNGTIRALCRRIELEIDRKLFAPSSGLQARFDLSERLRGDWEQVAQAVTATRQWGIATINESRRLLGFNALDNSQWGDSLLVPVNMVPVNAETGEKLIAPVPIPQETK
jgi:HK97 family phage portal protein